MTQKEAGFKPGLFSFLMFCETHNLSQYILRSAENILI
jgi:hypothetical protein